MVQLRDIFPALLLVGCAGKIVLLCRLYSGSVLLLLGCCSPCLVIVDRRRSFSLPARCSGVLFSGCGGRPTATDANWLTGVLGDRCFFLSSFFENIGTLLLTCFLRTNRSICAQVHARTRWRAASPCVTSLSAVLLNLLDI